MLEQELLCTCIGIYEVIKLTWRKCGQVVDFTFNILLVVYLVCLQRTMVVSGGYL